MSASKVAKTGSSSIAFHWKGQLNKKAKSYKKLNLRLFAEHFKAAVPLKQALLLALSSAPGSFSAVSPAFAETGLCSEAMGNWFH